MACSHVHKASRACGSAALNRAHSYAGSQHLCQPNNLRCCQVSQLLMHVSAVLLADSYIVAFTCAASASVGMLRRCTLSHITSWPCKLPEHLSQPHLFACCSARDAFLQQELSGDHEEVLAVITQFAEDLVACTTVKLLRYLAYRCQAVPTQGRLRSCSQLYSTWHCTRPTSHNSHL